MTSTNDGKDVKSNQTSGHKGKTYYIELYKSLEARLSASGPAQSRTAHVAEAWRTVHTLCLHSAPSTHTHLLSWLQRHTHTTILQTEWQSPQSKDDHKILDEAILAFIEECEAAIEHRDGVAQGWERQLLQRAEWLRGNLENPWGHPVLRVLLDPREEQPSEESILEWMREERGSMFVTRLRQLASSKCDDLALTLASSIMDRVRATTVFRPDVELVQNTDKPEQTPESPLRITLTNTAGFTMDVWELLGDIEFVLLYKLDKRARCIELAKLTPLRGAYQLVERLRCRLETSPREKKLWKNAKDVATLIAQVVIARCMVVPQCTGVVRAALYCSTRALCRVSGSGLARCAAALAAPAATSHHLHTLAHATHAQVGETMKSFVCELYVRALTAGMNELERLKLKTEKEAEARATEKTLSAWLSQVGALLAGSARLQYECALTAFSVHPAPQLYRRIRSAPPLPAADIQEPKNESESSEFGSWANDSRAQTNFVKTSEHLKLKQSQNHANVLSTAILNEGETIGLEPDLCQDLAVLLSGPRLKTLSWDMDREALLENCRQYMERTNFGTRAVTTELKYLNLDYSQYQHLPEEQDETNLYYGIEKGYEHLVESEPDPEEIWQTATEADKTESEVSSDDSEKIVRRRKKKKPKKPHSSEDDSDPLSLFAEAKKKSKKMRPHSKERSQDTEGKVRIRKPKKTEVDKEENVADRSQTAENGEKKLKKPRKPRKKKEVLTETTQSSLSSFVGVKVMNLGSMTCLLSEGGDSKKHEKNKKEFKKERRRSKKVSKTDVNIDCASQIDSSIYAEGITFPEPNVVVDGLFSMDEIKSPGKGLSLDGIYRSNESLSTVENDTTTDKNMPNHSENKKTYNYYMASGLQRSDLENSVITTNYTVSNQVKSSINDLLSFRRQKAQNNVMELQRLQQETNTFKNLQQKPSTVTSIQINKTQKQQIQALADEVNNLMNMNKNSKLANQPMDNATNDRLLQLNNEISMLKTYDRKKQEVSRDQNTANEPTASYTSDLDTSNFSILNQEPQKKLSDHQMSFEQFLKDLQNSLNAGAKVDPSRGEGGKSVVKNEIPQRKITLPENIIKRPEVVAPQCAKIQQKKVENAPNTFSRLSYMHKNKQTDNKVKQDASTLNQLDKAINDCKLSKVKYLQMKGEVNICRVPNTYECPKKPVPNSELTIIKTHKPSNPGSILSKTNPLLAQTLATPAQTNTRTNYVSGTSSELSYKTIMTDKDQAELLLLLRQQSKLNSSIQKSVKKLSQTPVVNMPNSKVVTERLYPDVEHNLYRSHANKPQIVQSQGNFEKQNFNQIPTKASSFVIRSDKTQQSVPHTQQSNKTTAANDEKQDWASVMNEILSHKTPYRGPNALNMALNKTPTALYNPPQIKTDNIKSVTKQRPTESTNESDRNMKLLQNKVLQCSGLQVKKVQPRKSIQITSQTIIKPAHTQYPKLKDVPTKRPAMPNDPIVNSSSEYDLLDELLDDDLRKEIGELSSDEDTYTHTTKATKYKTAPIPDSLCVRAIVKEKKQPRNLQTGVKVKKPVSKPVKNTAFIRSAPSSSKTNVPSSRKINTVPGMNLALQNAIIMRKSQVQSDNTVVVQSEIYNPIKIVQNNQMNVINNKSFYYTPTPQLVQNVVVMNPGIVYDQYVQIQPQNTAVCVNNNLGTISSAPDLTLYQTTQYAAPVINPIVIGNAMTSQNINMPQFNNVNQPVNLNERFSEQLIKVKETTPSNAKTNETIQNTQLESKNTNLDINCNKSSERKVLSQVQEKLKTNEKREIKTSIDEKQYLLPEKTNKTVTIERPTHELDEVKIKLDQERIKNKRLNIINREINHRCHYPTIPLRYESLKNLILDNSVDEINSPCDSIEQQNTKENDEEKALPACRRILLRSSNNLNQKLVLPSPTKPKVIKKTSKLKPEVPKKSKQRDTKVVKPKQSKKAALPCKKIKRRTSQRLVNLKDAVVKNNTEVELLKQSTNVAETKPVSNVSNESQIFDDIEEQLVGSKIEKIKFANEGLTTLPDVVPVAEKTASSNICLPIKEDLYNTKLTQRGTTTFIEEQTKSVPDLQESVMSSTKENSNTNEMVENNINDKNIKQIPNEILPLEMEVTEELAITYSNSTETTQNVADKSKKLAETLLTETTCTIKDTIITKVPSVSKNNTIVNNPELKSGSDRSFSPLKIPTTDNAVKNEKPKEINNFLSQTTPARHELDRTICEINKINTQDAVKNTLTLPNENISKKPIVIEDESKEFASGIVFTELPSSDINSKCISIKLRNGNSYKATVRGNMAKMNLETLFKDPSMKKHLINLSNCQRYTVNIKQVSTLNSTKNIIKRTISVDKNPESIETVDLISDDEIEESPQCFKTEYGVYKVKHIDDETFKSHQSKFAQKCVVRSPKFQYQLPKTIPTPKIIVSKPPKVVSKSPIILPEAQIIAPKLDYVKLQHDDTIQELPKSLTKDLTGLLDTPKPLKMSDVIEIDDSSSDGVTDLDCKPQVDSIPFKKLLIKDLFSKEVSDKTNNLPSTKNCHVPMSRCDDLVKQMLETRLIADASSYEKVSSCCSSPKSEISRCGSISILNDFNEFEIESTDFECDFGNYESSPVMEAYDTIVSLNNEKFDQVTSDIAVDRNSLCDAEWCITKVKLKKHEICKNLGTTYSSETKLDKSQTEGDYSSSSIKSEMRIFESKVIECPVPSLMKLVLKLFENNPILYFSRHVYVNTKENLKIHPALASNLKRKNVDPCSSITNKITKIVECDRKRCSNLNITNESTDSKTNSTLEICKRQLIKEISMEKVDEEIIDAKVSLKLKSETIPDAVSMEIDSEKIRQDLALQFSIKDKTLHVLKNVENIVSEEVHCLLTEIHPETTFLSNALTNIPAGPSGEVHMESYNFTDSFLSENITDSLMKSTHEFESCERNNKSHIPSEPIKSNHFLLIDEVTDTPISNLNELDNTQEIRQKDGKFDTCLNESELVSELSKRNPPQNKETAAAETDGSTSSKNDKIVGFCNEIVIVKQQSFKSESVAIPPNEDYVKNIRYTETNKEVEKASQVMEIRNVNTVASNVSDPIFQDDVKNKSLEVNVAVQSLDSDDHEKYFKLDHDSLKDIEYKDHMIGKCYVFTSVAKSISDNERVDELSEETNLVVKRPKITYSTESRKRKHCVRDVKIPEKKYRKGKNIDYPKLTSATMRESAYVLEFKRLIQYFDAVDFSYSRPFHKECINVEKLIKNWPIPAATNEITEGITENQEAIPLFEDLDKKYCCSSRTDPMARSLDEELSANYNEIETVIPADSIREINFEMGFGEGSDRVIQNLKSKDNVLKYSAATLSDVKQSQPFLLSEDYEQCELTYISTAKIDDQIQKLRRHSNYLTLRKKIRTFFEKTTAELNESFYSSKEKGKNTRILHDLCDLGYIEPSTCDTVVQVVQVGQLPVSAAAQNPVTCDPRVTQVSDASPSQCSVENSPRDDSQSGNKTEYTELTTADLTLPLVQEYAQQNQNTSMETQESASMSMTDQNIPIETEVKSIESKEDSMENEELQDCQVKKEISSLDNSSINNIEYSFDSNNTSDSLESDPHIQIMLNSAQQPSVQDPFLQSRQQNGEKTDQIAHAMNAAGITTSEPTTNTRTHALVNILSQKIRQSIVSTSQTSTTTNFTKTSINAMALQQALAQILPPPLNQTNSSDNNQQIANSSVTSQVLHIVQGKNASGNQITLVDNSQQSVISNTNATQVLHIVQNKNITTGQTSNGTAQQQTNAFSGLSLVDTGLQQGGNQLLHIVNTGNQKNPNASQLLKRVNLLTNLTSVQGSNEQKMVQFVCKSADGKSIQLNAPHQRSMVLRLQPIETPNVQNSPLTPKPTESQGSDSNANATNSSSAKDSASSQEIKSRSVYEENYAKFIQNSSTKPAAIEKSTSLPKFNQAFGKPVFQEGSQKSNDLNGNNSHIPPVNSNTENNESQPLENSINLDHIRQISSPPLLLRKSPAQTTQAQQNLVQQIKQTIAPMNIQTMHGGVIYTRQIPVNIGGGQTINLITVPSTELIDDSNQKTSDVKFVNQGDIEQSIIKIVPQTQTTTNADGSQEEGNNQIGSNDSTPTPQPQPVLTQMRIKLPMLSKTPQMVPGARVVRPSFFQIQRNVIGGANQPVYQQLVLTAAPPLGQQTIRLPQAQPTRPVKVPSENQSSESQMSSSTLEQLREFDMVLEQVKERSTVQPNNSTNHFTKLLTTSTDTTDSVATVSSNTIETTQQVLYSIGGNQSLNVAYVNRKVTTVQAPTMSSFVRSPDSSGISDSPTSSTHTNIPHNLTTDASSSDAPAQPKPAKVGSKTKSRPKASSNPPNTLKLPTPAPKTSTQKPLEDEQTTQRILYILAEYKEQVENSPDKDKPAPRRRSNPPSNPSGSSKRKKSSSGSRRSGRDMSPVLGEDTCRTMGSEDSSCGTSQGDCTESCLENSSPQDSPRKVARKLTFEQEATPPAQQPRPQPQRNVIVADGQTITVARGTAGKPATAVIMPANYILPVSVMKGGQQIAIVTNRGPKLLTVGGGEAGTTNALLLQRLIGPAGLKPVLARPGVRHVRLPTTALHNLQAFNIATTATVQPPDSTASPAPAPTPELIETQAVSSPWADRTEQDPKRSTSPEASEPWNLPSDSHEYSYEETVRTDNMDRTVLDQIPDRYSPDMEAQRIFDKMFDVESKKSYIVDSQDDSPRCAYDIDASDCDDKPYQQVVQKKDSSSQRQTRLTHVSAAALRHKYAILEHELRLQKSLSEECEDLGVDSPSASELFPEAELLFAASPAHDHSQHEHTTQPTLMNQSCIPQPDIDDQIATDELIRHTSDVPDDINEDVNLGLEDVGIVTVSEDGMQATIALDQEEFARSHPNTTFHSEPTDGEVQPFSLAGLKGRQITSTIFHSNSAPATVLMTTPQATVISQVTTENAQDAVKYNDIDMMNSLPSSHGNDISLSSVLVKDDGLTRFDNILNDSRELHLSNTASAIVHSAGNATQVIRRVYGDDKRERERFLMDDTDGMMVGDDPKTMSEDSSREATLESMADVDDDDSSHERHAELFWESNSASERSESRRPLDFSSDSEKCCKSPSFDETNSTDSSGHMRLDSVIKEARGSEELGLRTYPVRRTYSGIEESLSGKTRAGERSPDSGEVRRRASARGVVKRPCHCCNGSPAPQRPKKSRQRKPTLDFTTTD